MSSEADAGTSGEGNRYLAVIAAGVPEIGPLWSDLAAGRAESFEMTSAFAGWVVEQESVETLRRAFAAVEQAETESERARWNEAGGLTAEFCEVIATDAEAARRLRPFMGRWVSAWFEEHSATA